MPKHVTKPEVAQMIVLDQLGETYKSIGRMLGRANHTVKKYLNSPAYLDDPAVLELVEILRKKELDDLRLLGAKARARLHEILDEGKTKAIETTAIMDRSFQQRQLLEGRPTENINLGAYVNEIKQNKAWAEKQLKKLKAKLLPIDDEEGAGQGDESGDQA